MKKNAARKTLYQLVNVIAGVLAVGAVACRIYLFAAHIEGNLFVKLLTPAALLLAHVMVQLNSKWEKKMGKNGEVG